MFKRGEFDRKVTIRNQSGVQDTFGEPIYTPADYATRWAKKEYGGGSESLHGDREAPIHDVRWTFDFVTGLTEDMWILDRDGEIYDIEFIKELERKRYHTVFCKHRT